ncbi:hypothetical protein BH18THE2_BH18THE2_33070 [soil metagenome]
MAVQLPFAMSPRIVQIEVVLDLKEMVEEILILFK